MGDIFEKAAKAMGCSGIYDAISKLSDFINKLGLGAPHMRSLEEMEILKTSVNPERLKNNPIALNEEGICLLYRQILECD